MKLIVGLGNPGTKYEQTRHNVGFLAIDNFLKDRPAISCQSKFQAKICEYHEGGKKVFFVKPTTFMNLSGSAVNDLVNYYGLDSAKDLLVIHDEVDLPFGSLKSTEGSGSAGHNGVQSIIDELGSKNFHRIRVGVESRDPNSKMPTDAFVLQKFSDEELQKLESELLPEITKLIEQFIQK